MTKDVYAFVKELRDAGKLEGHVLDVGSYNVNGCVRELFPEGFYTGLDKRAGPNVDVVFDVNRDFPEDRGPLKEKFDHVLCLEMLEHVPDPALTVEDVSEFLNAGGFLVLTTRGIGYPLHDEPEDYYRFTEHSMRYFLRYMDEVEVRVAEEGRGIYGVGRKR